MTPDKLSKLQPARQTAASLRGTGAAAGSGGPTDAAAHAAAQAPTLAQRTATASAAEAGKPPPASCQQCLYVSFFFDGTGNNLKADVPTLEHSNVARLFRAMPLDDTSKGVFSLYIPGIGTLFPEVGDNGKSPIPVVDTHTGMGAMGQARLDFAFKELDKIIAQAEARAMNPTNKIIQIKIAVFGFSRGATLARAFVRDLLGAKLGKTVVQGGEVFWKKGRYPLSIEFMGLWDSVASVGVPMSANNIKAIRSSRRTGGNVGRSMLDGLLHTQPEMLRAVDLAFGTPGADPSPGSADGHGAWADGLAIPSVVNQCVQMIAGHEIRNSFPVDSLQRGATRAANCKEMIYPGAHSDVGGGYRPGEGGKGAASPTTATTVGDNDMLLSRVPLRAMYDEAVTAGVPLRKPAANNWSQINIDDFATSPILGERYNHYMNQAGWGGRPLGQQILAHTRYYFAWRWYRIANGRAGEMGRLKSNEHVFTGDRAALEQQQAQLRRERMAAQRRAANAQMQRDGVAQGQWMNPKVDVNALRTELATYDREIAAANADYKRIDQQMKEVQARLDGAADDGDIPEHLTEYDAELRDDAQSILDVIRRDPSRRGQLRPHYRNLIETYEDQFLHGRGLKDEKVIAFFDDHVHDSLAGFAKDSTLPSDPRVVYVGGDKKLDYAQAAPAEHTAEVV
jgi:hypothetical protein